MNTLLCLAEQITESTDSLFNFCCSGPSARKRSGKNRQPTYVVTWNSVHVVPKMLSVFREREALFSIVVFWFW